MKSPQTSSALPCRAGVGLRAPHYEAMLSAPFKPAWVEVHSENFFEGGAPLDTLLRVRAQVPVSLHGVGMGLGSPVPLDLDHLASLKRLVERVEPAAISEHLCWNRIGDRCFNDLLPFPLTLAAVRTLSDKIDQVQHALGRPIAIENLSSYVVFPQSTMNEGEFLNELCRRCGCGVLLDINNLYVNWLNFGLDPHAVLWALQASHVQEYHLAGFSRQGEGWVDTHSAPVAEPVWALFDEALSRLGRKPTLIEWDNDIPAFSRLLDEVSQAQHHLDQSGQTAYAAFHECSRELPPAASAVNETPLNETALKEAVLGASVVPTVFGKGQKPGWGMAVYHNNLCENMLSALRGAYPVLFQLMGEDCFRQLGQRFGEKHPSRHGNLHRYGEQLADFLTTDSAMAGWPWFSSMARLEWACHQIYFAPDAQPLDRQQLARVPVQHYATLRFVVAPTVCLLALDHAVLALWEAHQGPWRDDGVMGLPDGKEWLLIARQNGHARPQRVSPSVARWWSRIMAGASMGEMLASAMSPKDSVEPVEERWTEAMQQGWLVGFEWSPGFEPLSNPVGHPEEDDIQA